VEQLITEDNVDFLLGPFGSSCTIEAAEVAERDHVPLVEGEGAAEKIVTVWPSDIATGSPLYPTPCWDEREHMLHVAVLYCGTIRDYGWCYEGHEGAQDMAKTHPSVKLSEQEEACGSDTGVVWNWAPLMTDIVKAVDTGTWNDQPGQDWWYGLSEGGVELAPYSYLVPDDVKQVVEEQKQGIIEGDFEIFPGMTDEELREMYYFELNVIGELP
jgi:hypothetical protein